jgi:hypothetical protein
MKIRLLASTAALLAFAAPPASAECSWDWLCNGEGVCKFMPICDSINEVPPAQPESQPPAIPPLSMRPHRIAGAGIGAAQTLTCEHIMRKGKSGRWYWHEACFCTDPTKTKDPSTPFANIVRCDAQ